MVGEAAGLTCASASWPTKNLFSSPPSFLPFTVLSGKWGSMEIVKIYRVNWNLDFKIQKVSFFQL